MNRHNKVSLKGLIGGLLAGGAMALASSGAQAAAPKEPSTPCFFVNQWQGWKSPSPKIIYLGVNMHDVYRLDLATESSQLSWPDARLVSVVRGSSSICTALDLQLSVADSGGIREPLFPAKLTKMTPEEVAAIPKKFRPN